jgi:hypothetical protein
MAGGYYSKRTVGYEWKGGLLAQKLNQDRNLIHEMVKAEAPPIRVQGNRIYERDDKLPTTEILYCIERIAERM